MNKNLTWLVLVSLFFGLFLVLNFFQTEAIAVTTTLNPTADAHVNGGDSTKSATNYGTALSLSADSSPVIITYLKFDLSSLSGQTVSSAKLRLWVTGSSAGSPNVKSVSDTIWSESAITFNNRPALGSTLGTITGPKASTWVEVDITSEVALKVGQLMSLGIDSLSSDGADFNSKENTTNKPELVIVSESSTSTPTPTPTPTTTPTPTSDTTPPTVSVTSPISGSTVSNTITVSADASDNVGVVGAQFKLDGANLGSEDTSSPYSISWNTVLATNASHTLTAQARDAAGNTTTSTAVTVTVSNVTTTTDCNSTNFSFGVFSDTYSGQKGGLKRVLNEMVAKDPNIHLLITGGDTSDSAGNEVFQRVRTVIDGELTDTLRCGATAFPWLPTPGNHDSDKTTWSWWTNNWANNWYTVSETSLLATHLPGLTNFKRGPQFSGSATVQPGTIYSFDYKNVHFISINNYADGIVGDSVAGVKDENGSAVFDPNTSQIDWLKQDLDVNTKPITFVYGHVAILAPCYEDNDCPTLTPDSCYVPGHSEHNSPFPNMTEMAKLLADHNVTAYFHGHDHVASRLLTDRDRNRVYDKLYCEAQSDPNRPIGNPLEWASLQGPGRVWQVDAGRVYTKLGSYVITKVSDTSVTFEIYYYFNETPGSTQLWDTWTVPIL